LIGGVIGVGFEEARGGSHSLGELAGAFVSGGIVGVGVINAPETGGISVAIAAAAVTGGTAAAAGNITKQDVDILTGEQKEGSRAARFLARPLRKSTKSSTSARCSGGSAFSFRVPRLCGSPHSRGKFSFRRSM
jgi:hypothetical protein